MSFGSQLTLAHAAESEVGRCDRHAPLAIDAGSNKVKSLASIAHHLRQHARRLVEYSRA